MPFHWTQTAIRKLVWAAIDGEDAAAIAARLGCPKRTVQAMQAEVGITGSKGTSHPNEQRSFAGGPGREQATPTNKDRSPGAPAGNKNTESTGKRTDHCALLTDHCSAQPRRARRGWTDEEKALVRREYADGSTAGIGEQLHRPVGQIREMATKLGLKKSPAFLRALARGKKLWESGCAHRFKVGEAPWNKGVRHPKGWAPGRMAETQFKKGERNGQAAMNWKPIGTISVDTEGYHRIKVRETLPGEAHGHGNSEAWPLLNRRVWEQAHGPIPPGYKIALIDGNRANCDLKNLELISEAEMMRRNSVHNLPDELARVIQLAGALKRKLRETREKRSGNAL